MRDGGSIKWRPRRMRLLSRSPQEYLVGRVASVITGEAADRGADLIVMGTHGRGGLAHALLGSVAERVVRTAPCSVLTVRDASRTADIATADAVSPVRRRAPDLLSLASPRIRRAIWSSDRVQPPLARIPKVFGHFPRVGGPQAQIAIGENSPIA